MKAIILAAGKGVRLQPFTLNKPKCLVEIEGSTLIDRQIKVLNSCGINEIIIVGGYLAEKLAHRSERLIVNKEYANTNMVYTLFSAEDDFNGDVIVSYGDIVYSPKILNKILASESDISVAVDMEWENYWRARSENFLEDAETLKLTEDNKIIEIGKRPNSLSDIQAQYIGLSKYSSKGVGIIKTVYQEAERIGFLGEKEYSKAYMTDLIQCVIDNGFDVSAVKVSEPWIEIDTKSDLHLDITVHRASLIEMQLDKDFI